MFYATSLAREIEISGSKAISAAPELRVLVLEENPAAIASDIEHGLQPKVISNTGYSLR